MSDTWNQHPANQQPPDKGVPPKTGGLLSNYKNQQSQAGLGNQQQSQAGLGNQQQSQAGQLYQYQQGNPQNNPQNNQNIQRNQSKSGLLSYASGAPMPPPEPAKRTHSSLLKDYASPPGSARPGQPPVHTPSMSYPPMNSQVNSQNPQGYQRSRGSSLWQYSQEPSAHPPQPGHPFAQPWSNARDMMRTWSGKMVAAINSRRPGQGQSPVPGMPGGPGGPGSLPGGPGGPGSFPGAPGMGPYRPQVPQHAGGNQPGFNQAGLNAVADRALRWEHALAARFSQQKQQRVGKKRSRVVRTVLISLVAVILIVSVIGGSYGYYFYQQQLPLVQKYASKQISQNTRIYDRNGVLLYEAYEQGDSAQEGRRVAVTYDNIPKVMQDAMISIEDKNFWTNDGVDPLAIIRAGTSSGGGASTLTQQLIKNLSGNDQVSYQRKLSEAAMAIGLTQNYSKSKIMEMYFNVAPFGANTYGVEVAAEDLFGLSPICKVGKACIPAIAQLDYNQQMKKNDQILGLARASLLAAIPNNPSYYDPSIDSQTKALALGRQKLVLQDMISQGRQLNGKPITQDMAQSAEAMTAKMTFKPYQGIKRAPHFVDYVVNEVETALGNGNAQAGTYAFLTGGYNIRTTIDVNLDEYTQRAIQRHLDQPEYQKARGFTATLNVDNNVNNAAVVVMDAKNGEVLTMVGSANYNSNNPKVDGQYNAAVSARPPGSTFKPFDYATAFEMGWTPGVQLQDIRTYFPNGAAAGTDAKTSADDKNVTADKENASAGIYSPSDYGQTYWNKIFTNRMATANSFNIAAIRAMQFTGQQAVLNTVQRLGITGLKTSGLSTAIGSQDISPLQMADAYEAFANNGSRVPPQTILDIWDNYGNSLYHYDENNPPAQKVFSPQVAYMMTSVLIDEPSRSFEFSGDHDLSFTDIDPTCAYEAACGHQVAAKTGTTDSFADNWTIGYTPDVVVAVWAGNSDDSAMTNVIGITGAAPIWHSVMERTLGYCNHSEAATNSDFYDDGISCGPSYNFRFSKNPQWQFTVPSGLEQSIPAGLSAAAESDWMLNGD